MFSTVSVRPFGPTAPTSRPPWPASSTTSTAPIGAAPVTVAGRSHGVVTFSASPSRPTTGTTTPLGVMATAGSTPVLAVTRGRADVVVVVAGGAVDGGRVVAGSVVVVVDSIVVATVVV